MTAEPRDETAVFLHGIGDGPGSWAAQLAALPEGFTGWAPRLAGLGAGDEPFTLTGAAAGVLAELDDRDVGRAHLCGLSLGALVALRLAADHPSRVSSLVISGGQVRPNRILMAVQNAVIGLLPSRLAAPPGLTKPAMLAILHSLSSLDLRAELATITAPTLVLCGARDRANLPAARALAAGIPGAELQIVPGAGHTWNTELPEEFSRRLTDFYRRLDL